MASGGRDDVGPTTTGQIDSVVVSGVLPQPVANWSLPRHGLSHIAYRVNVPVQSLLFVDSFQASAKSVGYM